LATLADEPADLETPYWRLDDAPAIGGLSGLAGRMKMAVRPVISTVRAAAPRSAAIVLGAQLVSAAATAGMLLLLNEVLGALLAGGGSIARLQAAWPALAMLALAFGLKTGSDAVAAIERARIGPRVRRNAEQQLLSATLGVQLASYDNPQFYDQLQRARDRGILHLETSIEALVDAIASILTVAGAIVALFVLHPLLVPLMLTVAVPGAWSALAGARAQYEGMSRTIALARQADMYRDLATGRSAAPEIRANQAQSFLLERFSGSAETLQDHVVAVRTKEARIVALGSALSALALVAAFVLLAVMIRGGWIDLAVAGAAAIAMRAAAAALTQLATSSHEIFQKALYISDYRQFLDLACRQASRQDGRTAPSAPQSIELSGVGFCYPGAQSLWVLRDISMTIEAGQTVALVGENGSGKTTLAKLIAGLYEPTQGAVLWDGIDLRAMLPDSIADRVSMVLQEPVKWPQSARSNVEIGRHSNGNGDPGRLQQVALQSGAIDVVRRLPNGWETLLSREFSGGHDLSAGQWQRLAVARGLYRDAPIVIWDEPTAPLDAKSERAAYQSLQSMARDRTVILITHRLTSVRNADRIFFLQHGALVEAGRHEELMELNGHYAQLYSLQVNLFQAAAL